MNLPDQVLAHDNELAKKLHEKAVDCSARLTAHTYIGEYAEAEECLHEYQRALNDLKYLKFRKIDQERKIANVI